VPNFKKFFKYFLVFLLSLCHILPAVTSTEHSASHEKVLKRRFMQQNFQSPRQHRRSDFGISFCERIKMFTGFYTLRFDKNVY